MPVVVHADDDGDHRAGNQLAVRPRDDRDAEHGAARCRRRSVIGQHRFRAEAWGRRRGRRAMRGEPELFAAAPFEEPAVGVAIEEVVQIDVAAAHRARKAGNQSNQRRRAPFAGTARLSPSMISSPLTLDIVKTGSD